MAAIAARIVGARHAVQPEPAGRRAGVRAGAGGRGGPRRPAGGGARGGGADGERARAQGQARHHAVALQHRAVPAVFGAARSAREGVQGLDHARRQRRQDRQPQDRAPRSWGCRAERAQLLGFKTAADSALEFSMAKTPQAVRKLLMEVWAPARARAGEERDQLQKAVQAEGGNFKLAAWDWRYYAEKVRKAKLRRRRRRDQALPAARQRHRRGLRRGDASCSASPSTSAPTCPSITPTCAPSRCRRDGKHVGVFLGDYFARPSKHSGAWMSGWRKQERLGGQHHARSSSTS